MADLLGESARALERPFVWGDGLTGNPAVAVLPAGTVTFLLSDIEGSTRLWEASPEAMAQAVPVHYEILTDAVARRGGLRPVEQGEGDSVVGVFARASDAVAAALDAQRRLATQVWPGEIELRVRVALHTAEAQLRDEGNYFGVALSRCARVRAIAYGGQTLLTGATHDLVLDALPDGASLIDLGMHRLRDLGRPEHVHALVHADLPADFPPPRSLDALANNLPHQLTSFVGRHAECEQVRQVLESTRLLTLTGAGGCGKTRLSLQVAADVLDRYPDGAWFVELAPLTDPELVPATLMGALGVRPLPGSSPAAAVIRHLSARRALVLLDNCEHVLEASAALAEALLHSCPGVDILATSRAPLGVPGETDWRVPSLSLPRLIDREPIEALTQYDAVRLFIERAAKVRPNFTVSADNAPAIAQLCFALDGIPLAIELAATRVRVMAVDEIAERLSDRFRLLTGGARTAMPRQQTLRASIDWSHALLSESERVLFRRLSVFAGGWTLDAAEEVCASEGLDRYVILDLLSSLAEKSLIATDERYSATRFGMLESVRQYARDMLSAADELDALRARHRNAYVALAERVGPQIISPHQVQALAALDADAPNLAAALECAIETDPERALRITIALTLRWRLRGNYEQADRGYVAALDAARDGHPMLRARALWARGHLLWYAGDFEGPLELSRQAIELAEEHDDKSTLARALATLGTAQMSTDPVVCRELLERAIQLARDCGDDWCLADTTQILSLSLAGESRHEESVALNVAQFQLLERLGNLEFIAYHWWLLAWAHADRAEFDQFAICNERALVAARTIDEAMSEGVALVWAGRVELAQGRPEAAIERLEAALPRLVARGAALALPLLIPNLAWAEVQVGLRASARARLEGLVAMGLDEGYILAFCMVRLAELLRLEGDPGAGEYAAQALETARRLDHVLTLAGAARTAARLAIGDGEWTAAEQLVHEALAPCAERQVRFEIPALLDVLAEVAAGLGSHEEAARLIGAVDAARADLGLAVMRTDQKPRSALVGSLREALGDEAFELALREGGTMPLDEAIAWVRRARGERKRPPGGWESLTPTELRVVELTAEGLTNPQIGELMFVTRGTVKTHLAHVYAKLGVRNRSELAAVAARRQAPRP